MFVEANGTEGCGIVCVIPTVGTGDGTGRACVAAIFGGIGIVC